METLEYKCFPINNGELQPQSDIMILPAHNQLNHFNDTFLQPERKPGGIYKNSTDQDVPKVSLQNEIVQLPNPPG